MKQSHKILAGTAITVGLLGLGGAAIAAPYGGEATPSASPTVSASPSASATPSMSTEELGKLYAPIITASENVLKEITAAEAKATGTEKERLGRMKKRAERELQFLKDRAAGKVPAKHDRKGRGGHHRHGAMDGAKDAQGKSNGQAQQGKDDGEH